MENSDVLNRLVIALGPAFACGFAIQRVMGIFDPWLDKWENKATKTLVLGIVSIAVGWWLACHAQLRVLWQLGANRVPHEIDCFVTGVFISAGTEGFNSIMKFLGYVKEEKSKAVK